MDFRQHSNWQRLLLTETEKEGKNMWKNKNRRFLYVGSLAITSLIILFEFTGFGIIPSFGQSSRKIEVAVLSGKGVGPSANNLMDVLNNSADTIHTTVLNGEDIRDGALNSFDVFIVPGGSGKKESQNLSRIGALEVKRFINGGGCYLGICAGCYLASNEPDFLGLLPVGIRDRQHWFRGMTTLPIEFTSAGEDVFGITETTAEIVYHNGPVLDCRPILDDPQLRKDLVPLAFFRGEIVGRGGEVGVMNGSPAMVLTRYGKGLVLGISPHPEKTPPLHKIIPHALRWLKNNVGH